MSTLRDAYDELSRLLPEIEPFEAVERVEAHRAFWRPDRVRVVLLAESHVFTPSAELDRRVVRLAGAPAGIPDGFARFVYCLGYGENGILDRPIAVPENEGTWQFWRLFASCLHGPPRPAEFRASLGSGVPRHVRLANKLALLGRLREAGVWLLDASPAALYAPGGLKPPPRAIREAIEVGYEAHVRRALEAAAPSHVICVGMGVGGVLEERVQRSGIAVKTVPQPQARLSADKHLAALAQCHAIVAEARER